MKRSHKLVRTETNSIEWEATHSQWLVSPWKSYNLHEDMAREIEKYRKSPVVIYWIDKDIHILEV